MVSYVSSLPARGGRRVAPLGPNEFDLGGGVTLRFVEVKKGQFSMGSPDSDDNRLSYEVPRHSVELTRNYLLGETEVTVGQFRQFVRETGYKTQALRLAPPMNWDDPGFAQTDDHPVVGVTWTDANEFCKWLSKKSGKACQLPTEAEWEYACRAGEETPFHFGEKLSPGRANYNTSYSSLAAEPNGGPARKSTAPVKQFRPNAWGLFAMHGNATEWCADWYGDYRPGPETDPTGPDASTVNARVIRGGSWAAPAEECRSAYRSGYHADKASNSIGFRVRAVP
jgi:formylglycine-generating enzyme required for sulfatase activity